MDSGLRMEYQISHVQSDQLRDTQASSEGKMKHIMKPISIVLISIIRQRISRSLTD